MPFWKFFKTQLLKLYNKHITTTNIRWDKQFTHYHVCLLFNTKISSQQENHNTINFEGCINICVKIYITIDLWNTIISVFGNYKQWHEKQYLSQISSFKHILRMKRVKYMEPQMFVLLGLTQWISGYTVCGISLLTWVLSPWPV